MLISKLRGTLCPPNVPEGDFITYASATMLQGFRLANEVNPRIGTTSVGIGCSNARTLPAILRFNRNTIDAAPGYPFFCAHDLALVQTKTSRGVTSGG